MQNRVQTYLETVWGSLDRWFWHAECHLIPFSFINVVAESKIHDGFAVADQTQFSKRAVFSMLYTMTIRFTTMLLGAGVSTPPANTEV